MDSYSKSNVLKNCIDYFNGDELAGSVCANKYLLKDKNGNYLEKSPEDIFKRIASEFSRIENKYKNPISYEEIYDMLKGFKKIIPQGSPLSGIGNNNQVTSIANCFAIDTPVDSYAGIFQRDEELVQIMKRRGGVGIDLSSLRPSGANVNNSAQTSDGVTCFMNRYSNTTKEVAQNGRRGALMLLLDSAHIDIIDFIKVKRDFTKITGANISVKWNDEFLKAVKNNEKYTLRFPVDASIENAKYTKEVNAKEVWDLFVESNWMSAEPGCLFWNRIVNQSLSDCYKDFGFKTIGTNPCITKDMWISTSNGDIQVKNLINVPFKASVYGKEFDSLKGFWSTGINKVYKIETENGIELKATINHIFPTFRANEWIYKEIPLEKLHIGDCLFLNTKEKLEKDIRLPFTKITKITYIGEEETFDCTVEDIHLFSMNGVMTHNCSELPLSAYGACILMVINLTGIINNPFTEKAEIDWNEFEKQIRIATRLIDDLIDLELERIDKIIDKINSDEEPEELKRNELNLWNKVKDTYIKGRRTGLGITGLGDMIAMLNFRYGSQDGFDITEKVFKFFHEINMKECINLAKERGVFPIFNWELEKDCHYIKILPEEIQEDIKKYGRRNISTTTISPAGSISLMSQTTSGVEPVFKRSYSRKRKMTKEEIDSGIKYDSIDSDGIKYLHYEIFHKGLEQWKQLNPEKTIEQSPYWKSESGEIDWKSRVKLQAMINKYISHSISSTVNLSKDVTKEEISQIYLLAHELGCKGLTIYREGSRDGIMFNKKENKESQIIENHAPHRPHILDCDIHFSTINQDKWVIFIGLMDGKPYEIFGGIAENVDISKSCKTGKLIKTKKIDKVNRYDLDIPDKVYIKDIANVFSANAGAYTRIISAMLRHGIPIKIICEQLLKVNKDSDLFSFEKSISRVLKKYIKDGEKAGSACPECGGEMKYEGGCAICQNCGWGKC